MHPQLFNLRLRWRKQKLFNPSWGWRKQICWEVFETHSVRGHVGEVLHINRKPVQSVLQSYITVVCGSIDAHDSMMQFNKLYIMKEARKHTFYRSSFLHTSPNTDKSKYNCSSRLQKLKKRLSDSWSTHCTVGGQSLKVRCGRGTVLPQRSFDSHGSCRIASMPGVRAHHLRACSRLATRCAHLWFLGVSG